MITALLIGWAAVIFASLKVGTKMLEKANLL